MVECITIDDFTCKDNRVTMKGREHTLGTVANFSDPPVVLTDQLPGVV